MRVCIYMHVLLIFELVCQNYELMPTKLRICLCKNSIWL